MHRWAVYDLEWTESDGRKVSKILFLMFNPDDNADTSQKFVVACNKDRLKDKIKEINLELQVNRWDDLNEEKFIKKFMR